MIKRGFRGFWGVKKKGGGSRRNTGKGGIGCLELQRGQDILRRKEKITIVKLIAGSFTKTCKTKNRGATRND